jgi:general secretion pathway protein D
MVKSGGTASIDVGNEIPVITSSSQSNQSADAPTVQSFSYRRTGVKLDIKPTVHASGFVDIEIQQELSEAAEGSVSGNPIILNRSLSTTVTLRDGGSVLIGGLISSTTSEGEQGIPILGKLPLIGKLFRTDTNTQDRTELMIMIIPYILNSPGEAEGLTDELQNERMQSLSVFN